MFVYTYIYTCHKQTQGLGFSSPTTLKEHFSWSDFPAAFQDQVETSAFLGWVAAKGLNLEYHHGI